MFEQDREKAPPCPSGGPLVGIHAGIGMGIGRRRCDNLNQKQTAVVVGHGPSALLVPIMAKCESGLDPTPNPPTAAARNRVRQRSCNDDPARTAKLKPGLAATNGSFSLSIREPINSLVI